MILIVRFWMWAGRISRWYADHHAHLARDAYDLSAACFERGHAVADELEAKLH